ncbi:hypothetical protein BGZ75_006093, partial [Mortierella antarctica]
MSFIYNFFAGDNSTPAEKENAAALKDMINNHKAALKIEYKQYEADYKLAVKAAEDAYKRAKDLAKEDLLRNTLGAVRREVDVITSTDEFANSDAKTRSKVEEFRSWVDGAALKHLGDDALSEKTTAHGFPVDKKNWGENERRSQNEDEDEDESEVEDESGNERMSMRADSMKLGKKIGGGAQAEIFKAKYGLDDVVVKRFLDSKRQGHKQVVAIIQQLTHKHIVQFYHVQQDMIVMEYVEGGNLADAILGKTLKTWEIKTRIAKDISLGLAHLQSQGIIHCDIKSSNILLTQHKEARICDFGHAIRVGESGQGGTLQWMAPELLQDAPQYSDKSDMYALGMVMWEMAAGSTRPYRNHTPDGMIWCIMNGILEEYPDNTPKDYAHSIQMCWKQVSSERPAAEDMLPDVGCSSQDQGAQEETSASRINNGEQPNYIGALKAYFKATATLPSTDMWTLNEKLPPGANKVMEWFSTSVSGHASALTIFNIGNSHYHGRDVKQNYEEALKWYLAASEAGVVVAMLKISEMYQLGHGVEQDEHEAESWHNKALDAAEDQSRTCNRFVHHDASVSEHHRETMEWFGGAERTGRQAIKLNVGNEYFGGHLQQDYNKALEWYLKASDDGNTHAMCNIAFLYHDGRGVEQNHNKTLEWYRMASDAGDNTAMYAIGAMYDEDLGVNRDHVKGREWHLKAAEAGNADAMYIIGILYHYGLDVDRDYDKAMRWYTKASDGGIASAMYNIGIMYHSGSGVDQDFSKAMEWFYRSSDAGNTFADCSIGA